MKYGFDLMDEIKADEMLSEIVGDKLKHYATVTREDFPFKGRITDLIEAAQPSLDYEGFEWLRRGALSDAVMWDREFGRVRDVSRLGVERNLFRYRSVPVAVRATPDATWQSVLRVVVAGIRAGGRFSLSAPVGLPGPVRRALGELDAPVFVETDDEWIARVRHERSAGGSGRVRVVGRAGAPATSEALQEALAAATGGDPELLPFLHEQSVSITAHRFGNPDRWSEAVI